MKIYRLIKKFYSILFLILMFSATACDDDPGVEHYYTTKAQYAADVLRGDGRYSKFCQILVRATGERGTYRLLDMLATYGSYTVFAPTNEAVDKYLSNKGLTSVDELSKEDCDTVALTHIMEQAFFVADFNNGTYPVPNMIDRFLTVTCDSDTVSVPGKVKLDVCINKIAHMIIMDYGVKNGVIHAVDNIILADNGMLPELLKKDDEISIFYSALICTGMADSLQRYIDASYSVGRDSIDWTNDKLIMSTGYEYDNVAYMERRYFRYSAFVEKDEVYHQAFKSDECIIERGGNTPDYNGCITPLDSLKALAKALYDPMYPEDSEITDPTDRRNSLNRFVSYHLLPFQQTYYQWTCVDGLNSVLAQNFNRRKIDISDWYETMMPHSLIKCSYPSGSEAGLYVNRRGVSARADYRGVKIRGAMVATQNQMPHNISLNGLYYYIDEIIAFDARTQNQIIGDERLRIDSSTLSPDFMTSGARGHYTRSSIENGKYGSVDNTSNHTNTNLGLGFKEGFVQNFIYSDRITHLHVRPRTLHMWCYQGDEVTILGRFDVAFKVPPVPAGLWELRVFTTFGFTNRGVVQFYFGKANMANGKLDRSLEPCGIPIDMRPDGSDRRISWVSDDQLGDDELIAAFDRSFHNRGWMKGFLSYGNSKSGINLPYNNVFRHFNKTLRRVITRFQSDGKSDYWLRMRQILESEVNAMAFDGIELCPKSVFNNEYYSEDIL